MRKLCLDLRKYKFHSQGSLIAIAVMLITMIMLCYFFIRNPYREIHEQIFETSDNIRNYYADRPGYWKLSTKSATDDRLIAPKLLEQANFIVNIGKGEDGEMVMPSDTNFDIALGNLSKSFCVGLSEAKIDSDKQLSLQKITVINEKGTTELTWGDAEHPLPVSKFSMRNICMPVGNKIIWTFR